MTLVVQYLHFKYFIEQLEVIWFIKPPDCFLPKPWGSDLVKFRLMKVGKEFCFHLLMDKQQTTSVENKDLNAAGGI